MLCKHHHHGIVATCSVWKEIALNIEISRGCRSAVICFQNMLRALGLIPNTGGGVGWRGVNKFKKKNWDFWRALKSFYFYRKWTSLFPKPPWITGTLQDIRLPHQYFLGNRKRPRVAFHLVLWKPHLGEMSLPLTLWGKKKWLLTDQVCRQGREAAAATLVTIPVVLSFGSKSRPRIKVTFWHKLSLHGGFPWSFQCAVCIVYFVGHIGGLLLRLMLWNLPFL